MVSIKRILQIATPMTAVAWMALAPAAHGLQEGGLAAATTAALCRAAPVAVDDADYIDGIPPGVSQGGGPQTRIYYVRANDSDADGDTLTITSVTKISGAATAAIVGGTHLNVTGITIGTHVFDYVISDGNGGTDTGRLTIERTWTP